MDYDVHIANCVAESTVVLTYENTEDKLLEVELVVPTRAESIISKIQVQIRDRIIETLIQEKQKAKEKYEDAVAGGHSAAFAELVGENKDRIFKLMLGNVQPADQIVVRISLVEQLNIVEGAFHYSFPLGFKDLLTYILGDTG